MVPLITILVVLVIMQPIISFLCTKNFYSIPSESNSFLICFALHLSKPTCTTWFTDKTTDSVKYSCYCIITTIHPLMYLSPSFLASSVALSFASWMSLPNGFTFAP